MTHQKDQMPDEILPCDFRVGTCVFRKGVKVSLVQDKVDKVIRADLVQAKDAEIAKLKEEADVCDRTLSLQGLLLKYAEEKIGGLEQERDLLALNLEKYRNINYAGSQEMKNLAALTKPGHNYPAFISINEDTFGVSITVRSAVSETAETGGNIASINLSRKEFTGLLMQLAESEGK